MILSGPEIVATVRRTRAARDAAREAGTPWPPAATLPLLDVDPFFEERVGPNSYDVCLGPQLVTYRLSAGKFLDPEKEHPTVAHVIPPDGMILMPGVVYLGSTVERTSCSRLVPWLDGRSSLGRLGIQIHATAGRGDDGFGEAVPNGCPWTLEITVTHPTKLHAGMRIGQLTFFEMRGDRKPYQGRYATQDGPTPSRFWQDVEPESPLPIKGGS